MRTYKGSVRFDVKIVAPDAFLADMRKWAQEEGASEFITLTNAKYPDNDDAFLMAVFKNGLRVAARANMLDLFAKTGLGGTVSPPTVEIIGGPPEFNADVAIQTLDVQRKSPVPDATQQQVTEQVL